MITVFMNRNRSLMEIHTKLIKLFDYYSLEDGICTQNRA
jgi:hypothetical protein